jgi:hypothetical protein
MGSLFSGNLTYAETSELSPRTLMQSKSNTTRCSSSFKPRGTSEGPSGVNQSQLCHAGRSHDRAIDNWHERGDWPQPFPPLRLRVNTWPQTAIRTGSFGRSRATCAELRNEALIPGHNADLGLTRFQDDLNHASAPLQADSPAPVVTQILAASAARQP